MSSSGGENEAIGSSLRLTLAQRYRSSSAPMPESRPSLADLIAAGRLRPQEPDRDALVETLDLAERDVEAAAANTDRFAPWAETMLYEGGSAPRERS